MQHNEVEEESFVAPDTQGDADSPFIDASSFGGYQSKAKKRGTGQRVKARHAEPTRISHTEAGDVVEVEGSPFIIVRKCTDGRWARTWLIDPSNPASVSDHSTSTDYKSGPYFIPGDYVLDKIIMLRPVAWR